MTNPMRAAVYARFSSQKQRDSSIEDQVRNCRTHAEQRGWIVLPDCVFADRAISATVADRPAYQAMELAARDRSFDVLIVDDLSRIARDAAETHHLHNRLRFRDIGLVAIADGVDTTVSAQSSGLIIGIKAAMNEEYIRNLAEKTRRGLAGRVHAGLSPGGHPYGYTSEPVYNDPPRTDRHGNPQAIGYRRLVVPEEAEVVRHIFELYVRGYSARRIAETLNGEGVLPPGRRWRNRTKVAAETWSMSAIEGSAKKGLGILNNEAYIGKIIWNKLEWRKDPDDRHGSTGGRPRRVPIIRPKDQWVVHESPELRIISDELWQQAKAAQSRRSAGLRKKGQQPLDGRHRYLLSGLLRCGLCGAPMAMRSRHGYGCMVRANRGNALCENSGVVNRKALESVVLKTVREELYGSDRIEKLTDLVRESLIALDGQIRRKRPRNSLEEEIRMREAEAERLTASLIRCQSQGKSHAAEHLEGELESVLAQKKALEEQQAQLLTRPQPQLLEALPRLPELVRDRVDDLISCLSGGRLLQGRSMLDTLVDEITVKPGDTKEGRPCHIVRVRGAVDRAFGLLIPRRQMSVVAGAGFEPATSGL